jgi:hypothetical protein
MKTDIKSIKVTFDSLSTALLLITVDKKALKSMPDASKPLTLEITRKKKARALSANALMWELCDEIARMTGTTKEDVYKAAILSAGVFTTVAVKNAVVDAMIDRWESSGLGNQAVVSKSGHGYTELMLYFGSSTYSTEEMGRLIDYLQLERNEQCG